MIQCASCDTRITDDAAKTGICPTCGLPLPGIGGTMRFSASLFAQLPWDDAGDLTGGPESPPSSETTLGEAGVDPAIKSTPQQTALEFPESGETLGIAVPVVAPLGPARTVHISVSPEFAAQPAIGRPESDGGGNKTQIHESDINQTIDSRKLNPDASRRAESTMLFVPDEEATNVSVMGPAETTSSATIPGSDANSLEKLRQPGDTTLFGPETRLVIQPREIITPDNAAHRAESPKRPDYELVEVIGRGGMGLVFAARQTSIDREVAVKMIWPDHAQDEATRENFLSEAVITGELDHPNIVPIHDVGKDAGNALFYSMKRVSGTPWQKVVADLPQSENLRILMAVADAVAFAHSRGVVHRDLKPENVMLGEFGEVMVMDWGLAVVTPEFRKAETVSRTVGAGCTPSYAAPELVTGPLRAIGPHSDVYLLGAILYKIITGKPPHLADTPQDCCRVAARNKIHSTDEKGELVDIAIKAMATRPDNRYASVQDFQEAIRSYQSHSESLVLSARAADDLVQAGQTGDYQDFARAVFGYQQAYELWDGNHAAATGLSAARLAYAASALVKQDFDLGLTLLDSDDVEHASLAVRLLAGQRERNNRRRRLNLMYRTAIGLVAVIFVGGSIGMFAINQEKETANKEKIAADKERATALKSMQEEQKAKKIAEGETIRANSAKKDAEKSRNDAIESERKAKEKEADALAAKQTAEEASQEAIESQKAQAFEAYVAQIGLANEQINSNAFDGALTVLTSQKNSPHRGWEWYRLDYLARQGQAASARLDSEVEAVALDSTGERFAAGLRDGRVLIGRVADLGDLAEHAAEKTTAINHGAAVLAVAFSPDDQLIVSGGESGTLAVWNAFDGTRVGPKFTGHDPGKAIHRARLIDAAGRRWLLTASADRTAQLWDLSRPPDAWSATSLQVLRGHHLQVWDAIMSPDGRRIVTAGDDGRAVVWVYSKEEAKFIPAVTRLDPLDTAGQGRPRVFTGHEGAVYAAAFSPDSKLVATAGLDKRVLIWNPDQVVEGDLKSRMAAVADPLRINRALSEAIVLEGHTEPVHSLTFSRDGKYVLSGSDDNTIRSWPRTGDMSNVTVLRGHGGWVRSCGFFPNANETGDWNVISGSHDRQIKQWNVPGYAEVRALRVDRLTDHGDAVLAAAFNPQGDQIVTASRDHIARVWQLRQGKVVPVVVDPQPLKLFEGHDFSATAVRYLKDGRRVVTSGIDGQVCLWNVDTGAQLARLTGTGLAAALAVSPDDAWILTGSSDLTVKLWKLEETIADYAAGRESKPVHQFEGHRAQVRALAISPDGSGRFYSGDEAGSGRLWNLENWQQDSLVLPHHTLRINSAAFLPEGDQFTTAGDDGFVYICDAATGAVRKALDHRSYSESIVALGLTPDGRRVITIGEPPSENEPFVIFDWYADSGQLMRFSRLDRGVTVFGLALAPANRTPEALLAIGRRDDGRTELRGWNLATWQAQPATDGRQVLDDAILSREHATVWSAAWSPDGAQVMTAGGYEAQTWQLNGRRMQMRLGPHRAVAAAAFSNDGRLVVTGSWDESFKIWTIAAGSPRSLCRVPVPGGGAVNSVAFSPAAESFQILTAHDDGTARLWNWDPRTPDIVPSAHRVFEHGKPVNAAVFSHDGARFLTMCADGVGRVWDPVAETRKPLFELAGQHTGQILCGVFSADDNWIVTGGEDKQIAVWDAHSGETALDAPLQGHSAAITSLALTEKGDRLLTGSRDSTAKLWDLQINVPRHHADPIPLSEGTTEPSNDVKPDSRAIVSIEAKLRAKELLTLRGHSAEITSVAFSPDGRFVLTAGLDNSSILWLTNKP